MMLDKYKNFLENSMKYFPEAVSLGLKSRYHNLLNSGGLILIDDHGVPNDQKRDRDSLPYLLKNGFKILSEEYQVLLEKI